MGFTKKEYWSGLPFPSPGIFPTQGSNPGLPHCRQILYQLRHKGSPRILEWVTYPFSSRSSRLRNRTGVSCIAGGFFTSWAIREAYLSNTCLISPTCLLSTWDLSHWTELFVLVCPLSHSKYSGTSSTPVDRETWGLNLCNSGVPH